MHKATDIAVALVIVAGLFVVTRKGSTGGSLITSIGNAFNGALGTVTGQGGRKG